MSPIRDTIKSALLVFGWLVCIESAFQFALRVGPAAARNFLTHGESVETKLRKKLNAPLDPNDVVYAGWVQTMAHELPLEADLGIYGMSFTDNVARQMRIVAPQIRVRSLPGPGAPVSHTLHSFEVDEAQRSLKVVVLGLNDISSVLTMTADSAGSEHPYASAYLRFLIEGDGLRAVEPPVHSLPDLKAALSSPSLWEAYTDVLAKYDAHYEPLVFRASALEKSGFGLFFLRAYATQREAHYFEQYRRGDTFRKDTELGRLAIETSRRILVRFGRIARERHQLPLVFLIHKKGFGTSLYDEFHETLEAEHIGYVSTHTICHPTHPECFGPDRLHFTEAIDAKNAQALLDKAFEAGVLSR